MFIEHPAPVLNMTSKLNKMQNTTLITQYGNLSCALELGRDKDFYIRLTH